MKSLPQSFLGQKVSMDGRTRNYVVRYEEHIGKNKTHVLLFEQDTPVIFAVMSSEGNFLDSFYLSGKTNQASTNALERYKEITERKKKHRMTQDDLRDALKTEPDAKMKNENIMKHLIDEHLEDIKHQYPSRLLMLQKTEGKHEDSLIMLALREALHMANARKSFTFLTAHRFDSSVPELGYIIDQYPDVLQDICDYYMEYNEVKIVRRLLLNTAESVPLDQKDIVESLLTLAGRMDHIHYSNLLKNVLSILFKRVKQTAGATPKAWLNDTVSDRQIRHSIAAVLKSKKIG
ncbi:hypothetical protein CR205_14625 [Alteribacter lacisalsi]|uniref:Uncharacterized protein n=1 Tax=Alteribacter lacisalsi TaxID=2045244 RepID=A0A2W0H834_9BACI|nr:hypothetical protein [Alteribacter lacisalsi]PYZ96906.1 hypothetical protein CR205_14625 [Alteribacter lacisalsi]